MSGRTTNHPIAARSVQFPLVLRAKLPTVRFEECTTWKTQPGLETEESPFLGDLGALDNWNDALVFGSRLIGPATVQ